MAHRVFLKPSADRDLSKLPQATQRRIAAKIAALADTPRPPGVEKLAGGTDEYRIRVGSYRIVYAIEDDPPVVLVLRIADRKDVYRR
jgi:mRNA interferase RelE/StbE